MYRPLLWPPLDVSPGVHLAGEGVPFGDVSFEDVPIGFATFNYERKLFLLIACSLR